MDIVRLCWLLALAAPVAVASCTLDFNRYESKAGVFPDASGDSLSIEESGPASDASTTGEQSPANDATTADAGQDADVTREAAADGFSPDSPVDGPTDGAADAAAETGAADATDSGGADAADGGGADAPGPDAATDAGSLATGLVAFYRFDETSGTSAADSSGNAHTATLVGGASFAAGLQNDAVTMNGSGQYVSLPAGIVSGLSAFTISAWVNLTSAPTWSRIFDFGTGTAAYMFLTPSSGTTLRFSITSGGLSQEQQLNAPVLATRSWQHVAVTLAANTGTLYVDGTAVAQNTNMTTTPSALGATTQNWLGRSEYAADPYLNGQIDNFRIYSRALSAGEVQALNAGHL
jgi:Concanavalin A-like lectin/glucanases superfamily